MTKQNNVLITGASRGIGAETARLFADKGYSVCVNFKSNVKAAESIRQDVLARGVDCILVKADVSKPHDVANMFETFDRELGELRVLVNNAGILRQQSNMVDISEQRFSEVLNTNVVGCFLCCKEAVKRMSKLNSGSIVNVSSKASISGSPHEYVDYAASKAAVDTLTRGLALEVAAKGIRVNGVRPGLIDTDIHAAGGEPGRVARLEGIIPMRRGGKACEVAEAIFWLASGQASFVTGSFIDISGGL
ncbi:MAG: SDR family oxidoreductase [Cellvibrionaceae bacterium]|nr:SDR family oxidoreductase [Cellvibrionaceae bacterium]